jgi:hypothetical protein
MRTLEMIEEITKDLKLKELRNQTDQELLDAIDDDLFTLQ